jgi:hypothetical protein
MTTTRTIRAAQPGPIVLDVDTSAFDLDVTVDPSCTQASLTLSTDDDTGPSADAVNGADATAHGDAIRCRLHPRGNFGGGVVISGNSYGTIVTGGGMVMVNGRVISGGATGGSMIRMAARVPADSSVRFRGQSASLEVAGGALRALDAESQSGDVRVDAVGEAKASTQSGDVRIGHLAGYAELKSMSGDVDVYGGPGASARASTMSGDVSASGGMALNGSSMSGRVRNR